MTSRQAAAILATSHRTVNRLAAELGVARDAHGYYAWTDDDVARGREELAAREKRQLAQLKKGR
jgi:hypothetical protein